MVPRHLTRRWAHHLLTDSTAAVLNSICLFIWVTKVVSLFAPRELRARRRAPDRLVADGGLALNVPYRPPLAWAALLEFLSPRAIPGVETIDLEGGIYRRVVELGDAPGVIEVRDAPERSALRLRVHLPAFDGLGHLP